MGQPNDMKMISIAGAGKRVGVTHFCITLAGKLKSMGYKVAILEDNTSGDFAELADNVESQVRAGKFTYKNIDYYLKQDKKDIAGIRSMGYDYLIVDSGSYSSCDKDFFALSSVNFIIASARYWNFSELIKNVLEIEDHDILKNYIYVFPFASGNKKLQKEIVDSMDDLRKVYFSPVNENVFDDFAELNVSKYLGISDSKKPEKKAFFAFGRKTEKKAVDDDDYDEDIEEEFEDINDDSCKPSFSEIKERVDNVYQDTLQSSKALQEERDRIREEEKRRIAEEERIRAEEREKVRAEMEAKAKAEAEERFKAEAEAKAEMEERFKAEAEAKLKADTEIKTKEEIVKEPVVAEVKPEPVFEKKGGSWRNKETVPKPEPEKPIETKEASYLKDEKFIELVEGIKFISMSRKFDTVKQSKNADLVIKNIYTQLNAAIEMAKNEGAKFTENGDSVSLELGHKKHNFPIDEYNTFIKGA